MTNIEEFAMRAPTRLDFGGGWTDVPPYDVEQGGFVCNVAIARYATVRVRPLADATAPAQLSTGRPGDLPLLEAVARKFDAKGISISLTNYFPVAAGLGGSSAAAVAVIAAIARASGRAMSRGEIAEASRDVEIDEMGIAGGRQDHYAAAFGGALGIKFVKKVEPTPLRLTQKTIDELPRRCIVMYTGESRISATTITAVMGAYQSGDPQVRHALSNMRDIAVETAIALRAGDIDEVAELVREQWKHQRSLHPAIPTPLIDSMIGKATAAGATGCKALGASGGGCVLMIAPLDRADEVRRAVSSMGTEIQYAIDTMGVTECA